MNSHNIPLTSKNIIPDWVTIQEAVEIANQSTNIKITKSDIYRDALCGKIFLSIYFQSPVRLRKIQTLNNKVKLTKSPPFIPAGLFFVFCSVSRKQFPL